MASNTKQNNVEGNLEYDNKVIQDSELSEGDTRRSSSEEDEESDDSGTENEDSESSESEYEPCARKTSTNNVKEKTQVALKVATGGGRIGEQKVVNVSSNGSTIATQKIAEKVVHVPTTKTTACTAVVSGVKNVSEAVVEATQRARAKVVFVDNNFAEPAIGHVPTTTPSRKPNKRVADPKAPLQNPKKTKGSTSTTSRPSIKDHNTVSDSKNAMYSKNKRKYVTDICHPDRIKHYLYTDGLEFLDDDKHAELEEKRAQYKAKQLQQYIASVNEHSRLVSEHAQSILDTLK